MKKFYIKLFISIVILCLLFYSIDIEVFIKTLSKIDLVTFLLTVGIYTFGQIISAKKWEIISKQLGFNIKFSDYVKYYFKGMFYNTFLPTNIGGDIMKVTYICKDKGVEPAIISIITDRLSGVAVLIVLAFIGCFITHVNDFTKMLIFAMTALMSICIVIGIFVCKKNIYFNNNFIKKYVEYGNSFLNKSLITIFSLSLIFHMMVIIIHILIGQALELDINIPYYLVLYPLTAIAAFLPISLNGIGIKEAAYVYLLNQISIMPSQTISFVLVWNIIVLTSSLFGALGFIPKIIKNK